MDISRLKKSLSHLQKLYKEGTNITDYLSRLENKKNSLASVEIAYDLQAGSYIDYYLKNKSILKKYYSEISDILSSTVPRAKKVLDCGTGEMTTLSGIVKHGIFENSDIYAFDVSFSRIHVGTQFAEDHLSSSVASVNSFVADTGAIPLKSNSVDCVITVHSLEPNRDRLDDLISEIFRVSAGVVVLFEPSYERNSIEGKNRMDKLGYIRNLPSTIKRNGGHLRDIIPLASALNPLNPTHAYIIDLPEHTLPAASAQEIFACPITGEDLFFYNGHISSGNSLLSYPYLDGVPLLRDNYAVVTTQFKNDAEDTL